ncbi:DUF4012 domain-containing protein [Microterricola gilva]|uniref:DUF4012 domain-containing protein n=1 Tax=Microterricola gilva TaxID=393267 RepID=UPI00102B7D10|nr:DUF4012 domain-containing protein [Microterricola gilva]
MGVAGDGVADAHRPRTKRVVLIVLLAVVLLALAASGWLAMRVLNAKSALEQAEVLMRTVAAQLADGDRSGLPAASEELSALTAMALEQTQDPIWSAAEAVPMLGANLGAVRAIAESAELIARDAVAPLAAAADTLTLDVIKPVNGRINMESVRHLADIAGPAAAAIRSAARTIDAVDFDQTLPPLSAAGRSLAEQLAGALPVVDELDTALQLAPDMLGSSGPRSYVLVFQNLAESTALGGTAAALTELTIDDGVISIGRQASSQSFGRDLNVPVLPVDPGVAAVFNPYMYATLNLATSRPDFPTAAQLAAAFWSRDIGGAPDGVIAVDPVALSYILKATGPVALSSGDQLSGENAVALLLNGIYLRYPGEDGPDLTDAFFAEAARAVFTALTQSTGDTAALASAVTRGVDEHRIMMWSAHPEEQAALARTPLAGILPSDNTAESVTGVFFRDMSVSKVDFYLQTAATLTSDACTAASPTFTTDVELHSMLTQEQADALPPFVASGVWRGEKFKTQVFVYGPPGTTLTGATITLGGDAETFVGDAGTDLGRPVATYWVMLSPGETVGLRATFAGPEGVYGPPGLRTTPMLNATTTTVNAEGCPAG